MPTLHLHSSSGSSLTLSWAPPERPNGVILDYEMKYFEKVRASRVRRKPWDKKITPRQYEGPLGVRPWALRGPQGGPGGGPGLIGLRTHGDTSFFMVLQSEGIASTVTSQKNSVQLDGLRPDARYVVQVRARTVAGYGQYSRPAEFETTSERGMCAPTPIPAPAHTFPSSHSPASSWSPGSGAQQLQEQLPLIVGSATAGLVFVVAVVVIAVICLRYSRARGCSRG